MTDDRSKYIGGSDIAAIVGLSPWKSPLDIYLEKTGQSEPQDVTEAMRWGSMLEPLILDEYSRSTGLHVRRRRKPYVHKQHDFIVGHIDGIVLRPRRVVEVKATRTQWDNVPDYYQAQVQWYMHLAHAESADVVALVGGQSLNIMPVSRDEEAQRMLIEAAVEFWQRHVLPRVPPVPRSEADVQKLWAAEKGKQIVSTEEIERVVRELSGIRAHMVQLAAAEQECRDRIATYMQDAAELISPDGRVLMQYGGHLRKVTDWKQVVQKIAAKLSVEEVSAIVGECTSEKEVRSMRIKLGCEA